MEAYRTYHRNKSMKCFKKKKSKKVLTFEVNIWFCCKRPAYYTKSRFIGFYYYRAFQCKSVKKSIYRKWFQTIYVFVSTIQVWCTHINKAHKTKKLEIYLGNLRSILFHFRKFNAKLLKPNAKVVMILITWWFRIDYN